MPPDPLPLFQSVASVVPNKDTSPYCLILSNYNKRPQFYHFAELTFLVYFQ